MGCFYALVGNEINGIYFFLFFFFGIDEFFWDLLDKYTSFFQVI